MADIKTGVDRLVTLIKEKKHLTMDEAARALQVELSVVQEWAEFLRDEGQVDIKYGLLHTVIEEHQLTQEEYDAKARSVAGQRETFLNKVSENITDLEEQTAAFTKFKRELEQLLKQYGTKTEEIQKETDKVLQYEQLKNELASLEQAHLEHKLKEETFEKALQAKYAEYAALGKAFAEQEAALSAQHARVQALIATESTLHAALTQDERTLASLRSREQSLVAPSPLIPAPPLPIPSTEASEPSLPALPPLLHGSGHLPSLPPLSELLSQKSGALGAAPVQAPPPLPMLPPLPSTRLAVSASLPLLPPLPAPRDDVPLPSLHALPPLPPPVPTAAVSSMHEQRPVAMKPAPHEAVHPPLGHLHAEPEHATPHTHEEHRAHISHAVPKPGAVIPALEVGHEAAKVPDLYASPSLPEQLRAETFSFDSAVRPQADGHSAVNEAKATTATKGSASQKSLGPYEVTVVEEEPEPLFLPVEELDELHLALAQTKHDVLALATRQQESLTHVETKKQESLRHIEQMVAGLEDDLLAMHEKVFSVAVPQQRKHHSRVLAYNGR